MGDSGRAVMLRARCPDDDRVGRSRLTAEFSWFADYRWRYAFCAGCGAHLGWQFVGRADDAFWGLVLARLIESGE